MLDLLKNLQSHLAVYCEAVDRIFTCEKSRVDAWPDCFFQVLLASTQLYMDYLLLQEAAPAFDTVKSKRQQYIPADIQREKAHRQRLREHLEKQLPWSKFDLDDPFSEETGLHTSQDYIDKLGLHLSEVYEETLRIQQYCPMLIQTKSDAVFTDLVVAMEHIACHHILFVLPALQGMFRRENWEIPLN